MNQLNGTCHCKELKWTFSGPLESATACNCTSCRRYGALWAYGYVDVEIKTTGKTSHYMPGKALEFHFCAKCGNIGYWLGTSTDEQGRKRIAVNLRLVDEPSVIQHLFIDHFDGLEKWEDLPRDGRCVKDLWF